MSEPLPVIQTLEEVEKVHILNVLALTKGNISKTSKALKVGRQTLYNKLKKYGSQPVKC